MEGSIFQQAHDRFLKHYGTPRHSGRYPWGSGENPYQRSANFAANYRELSKEGMTPKQIAAAMEMTIDEVRERFTIAKDEEIRAAMAEAVRLKEKGYSTSAIARRMGKNESSVRNLLDPVLQEKRKLISNTADALKESLEKDGGYLNVGLGVERHLGITETKFKVAIRMLADEGYTLYPNLKIRQQATGMFTTMKVLAPPGTTKEEIRANLDKIHMPGKRSENHGEDFIDIEKPRSVDSKKVMINYAGEGGEKADGLIELRRGVPELSLGKAHYAQVRIAVDGTHYLKGMAVYADDLPEGVDIRFNTSKNKDVPMMGEKDNTVLKPIKNNKYDPGNPFGATIRSDSELILAQKHYTDENGQRQLSALNIVNEEGNWDEWSDSLSSQFASKQTPAFAKRQLDIAYNIKKETYDELMSLQNPEVKAKLLKSFAEECDSDAVTLKAAAMPRQATRVILPFNDLKDDEIYAPGLRDGEWVVLVRHPYSGGFESPRLRVNNHGTRAEKARKVMGTDARDAVGINYKVAAQMSGADFDGDTVLVIPDPNGEIRTSKPLPELKDFDPHAMYKLPPEAPKMKPKTKQLEMGKVSNLITDMTIKGAPLDEIARAVKHSMVVIDAEKHHLNYKQSFIDNDIASLKRDYQLQIKPNGKESTGAGTLISRSSSQYDVPERKPGKLMPDPETGKMRKFLYDPTTGEKLYTPTGRTIVKAIKDDNGNIVGYRDTGKLATKKSTRMAETNDAHTLSSGTAIENVYEEYANSLKALANRARLAWMRVPPTKYNASAKETYKEEVASILAKYDEAEKNAPLERQANAVASQIIKATIAENPEISDDDKKKVRNNALKRARLRIGAKKVPITFTPREWEAMQAGAFHHSKIVEILNDATDQHIKELAMPRETKGMSSAKVTRARQMIDNGFTLADVADHLGVSVSTLKNNLPPRE